MNLSTAPDDEDAYEAAVTELMNEFAGWLQSHSRTAEVAEALGDASVALDWKWSYADGELGSWDTADVEEFLMGWCPRKLSVSPQECESLPISLAMMFEWLDDAGYRDQQDQPLGELIKFTQASVPQFVAAMGDSTRFGLAKTMVAQMGEADVDLEDPDAVETWIRRFNELPEEVRRELIPDSVLGLPDVDPAVEGLPILARESPGVGGLEVDSKTLAESVARVPVLEMFRQLLIYVGSNGRALTARGYLKLADARALLVLLDTGDVMDETIGDRTFKTNSSRELVHLNQLFMWAKAAGLLRVIKGKVQLTRNGVSFARREEVKPEAYDRIVDGLIKLGPARSLVLEDRGFAWPDGADFVDSGAVVMLASCHVTDPRGVPVAELVEMATVTSVSAFEYPRGADMDFVQKRISLHVEGLLNAFALCGLVIRTEMEGTSAVGRSRRFGGNVSLTPAGKATLLRISDQLQQ